MAKTKQIDLDATVAEGTAKTDTPQAKVLNINNDAVNASIRYAKKAGNPVASVFESQLPSKDLDSLKEQGYEVKKSNGMYHITY